MRLNQIARLLFIFLAFALLPHPSWAKENPPANRITIEKAREVALPAYSGKIQGEELEFEGGKWIYSFDLKNSNDKIVHEVHVDAINGHLLDTHIETPADEKKELQEDQVHSESSAKSKKFKVSK